VSALDPEACYRAVQARDRRMDGQFFTGVVTTGIFCRPICPARTPLRQNVQFFASAAAALASGLRPCLRCRPEVAPDAAAAGGTAASVQRALRLIEAGALDHGSLTTLAARLGITDRHLRRLFLQRLGASPVQVAQARRLLLARALLADSDLSISAVASAAGYSSVRRFNAAINTVFARPPSALRSAKRPIAAGEQIKPNGVRLHLGVRGVLDWTFVLKQLSSRLLKGVETVEGLTYRRTISFDGPSNTAGASAILSLTCSGPPEACTGVVLDFMPIIQSKASGQAQAGWLQHFGALRARVRAMLDLDTDVEAIAAFLATDSVLAPSVAARPDLRLLGAWEPFELAVRAILGQQVSIAAGATLASRLVQRCGGVLHSDAADGQVLTHLFPTAEAIAQVDLTGLGLPQTRAQTLQGFARAYLEDPDLLNMNKGLDAFEKRLTALPGIGPWTAQYIALRGAVEPDAFPAADLVLLKAAAARDSSLGTPRALLSHAERWRPWRGYAARHLWAMA